MSSTIAINHHWSRGRWTVALALVLALHVGAIFWMTLRHRSSPAPAAPLPPKYVSAPPQQDWPALSDASLFVLANRHGFSERAWLQLPALPYDLPDWSEPPLPLALPVEKLGGALFELVQNDLGAPLQLAPLPDPPIEAALPPDPIASVPSHITLEGPFLNRALLSRFTLTPWAAPDILTNSVIQAGVDDKGTVVSTVLLSSSGLPKADARALELVRAARFEPANPGKVGLPSATLAWGNVVFHWQTVAPPPTNASTGLTP